HWHAFKPQRWKDKRGTFAHFLDDLLLAQHTQIADVAIRPGGVLYAFSQRTVTRDPQQVSVRAENIQEYVNSFFFGQSPDEQKMRFAQWGRGGRGKLGQKIWFYPKLFRRNPGAIFLK